MLISYWKGYVRLNFPVAWGTSENNSRQLIFHLELTSYSDNFSTLLLIKYRKNILWPIYSHHPSARVGYRRHVSLNIINIVANI